ncbi:MAG: aminotransferase class V-fold PLP-dependent enzyme [Opitutales bacterium]
MTQTPSIDPPTAPVGFDLEAIRADFPILQQTVQGRPLVYLDNAATAQKPRQVIDRLHRFYAEENANIHRGIHTLSAEATTAYEQARLTLGRLLNAPDAREIIFVRNATEGINLIAESWGRTHLKPGDAILITAMEHHANIVPWQLIAERTGATLEVVPVTDSGEIDPAELEQRLTARTKLFAFVHVSNVLGTINPAAEWVALARERGITTLVDGCQSVAHFPVDVQALGCDFFVLSGHKLFGPTGSGVLWGRGALLNALPPYQGGGDMIQNVSFEGTTFQEIPERFEAGTPHISGAIGLAEAVHYLDGIDRAAALAHEDALLAEATERILKIDGVRLMGTAPEKTGALTFTMEGAHPNDIATFLDTDGVAVRTGHHCAEPLHAHFGLTGSTRASFAFYNNQEEVDRFITSLEKVRKLL